MFYHKFTGNGQTAVVGELSPGFAGVMAIQVTNNGGLTITPEVSVGDSDVWVARQLTPADGTAGVTSITTDGVWLADVSGMKFRLRTTAGTGSAEVRVQPVIG